MVRVIGTTMKVVDQATAKLVAAASATRKLGEEGETTGKRLARGADAIARAQQAQLSASKQVEHAIRMEMAAGKPLEQQLLRLRNTYETLEVKMRATVRAGGDLDGAMVRQAAQAREAAEALGASNRASETSDRITSQMVSRFLSLSAAIKLATIAARELTENTPAVKAFAEASGSLVDSLAGRAGNALAEYINLKGKADAANWLAGLLRTEDQQLEIERKAAVLLAEIAEQRAEAQDRVDAVKAEIAEQAARDEAEAQRELEQALKAANAERREASRLMGFSTIRGMDAALRDLSEEKTGRKLSDIMNQQAAAASAGDFMTGVSSAVKEYTTRLEMENSIALAMDRRATVAEETADRERQAFVGAGQAIGSAMGEAFGAMITGSENAGDAMKRMLATMVSQAIQAAVTYIGAQAAKGGAAAAASTAELGPVALVAGPILGAAVAAMVQQVAGNIGGFASGGMVTGGRQGEDSVLGLLTPGERVLTVEQTRAFERLVELLDRGPGGFSRGMPAFAGGGTVPAAGGGWPMINVYTDGSAESRRNAKAQAQAIAAELVRLNKDGKFFLPRT